MKLMDDQSELGLQAANISWHLQFYNNKLL
jgi:hypothetical protein